MGVLKETFSDSVFKYFEEICEIPHGSKNTSELTDYLVKFAYDNGFDYRSDEMGNVVIVKEATEGYENSDTVMLQGHIDMVCEKNADCLHNFKTDPLKLCVMDDYIFAKGTTLGGDDGIAVAYMLSILENKNIKHPRLECVFTVDEEIGMLGANALDTSDLKAKTLLNLDSEEEGVFLSSCAGGVRGTVKLPVSYAKQNGIRYKLVVCGLMGGHSGTEIDKYPGNANIIMGRLLQHLGKRFEYSIIDLSGGLQDNAVPREAGCEILLQGTDGNDHSDEFEDYIREFEATVRDEYRVKEKNIQIYCECRGAESTKALEKEISDKIVFLLNIVPDGVQKMSYEIPGLVQTSLNLGIMRLKNDCFEAISAIRSSLTSEKRALSEKLLYIANTLGGSYSEKGDYPAWEYKEESRIRPLISRLYREMFGKSAKFEGIHAGLECGIFSSRMKDIDVVSFGPEILHIHTPKERLSVESVRRVEKLTIKILEELK